jgi:hypothetical protein
MTVIAPTLLFASAGLFAAWSMVFSARRNGPAALRLQRALRAVRVETVVRYTMTDLREVRAPDARILRPDFTVRAGAVAQPVPAPLRAAA